MSTLTEITIAGIDPDLLERQRHLLGDLSHRADVAFSNKRTGPRPDTKAIVMTKREAEALSGIVSMLNAWSDAQQS